MRILRTLLIALVALTTLASTASAKTAVSIDPAQATSHSYWYGVYNDPDHPNCSNTYDVNHFLPDVTPPTPGQCGNYTATNSTLTAHLVSMPAPGRLAVSLNVKNPNRTATASLAVNGVTVASQALGDNATKTWVTLPEITVAQGDDVVLTVKTNWNGQTGWFELHSVHGDLGDAPIVYGKPNSAWNTLIPADVALDATSDGGNTQLHSDMNASAPYINTTTWSSYIYRAKPDTPRVGVFVSARDGSTPNWMDQLQTILKPGGTPESLSGVPDPDSFNYVPQNDSDQEYAVYCADCTSPDGTRHGYVWEFMNLTRCDPATARGAAGISAGYAWCAIWGGRDAGVAESPGHPQTDWQGYAYPTGPDVTDPAQANKAAKFEDKGWLATATSLPLTAGEVTLADLTSGDGEIHHALGLSIIHPVKSKWYWPAQRSDGYVVADGTDLYEGARVQVDPLTDCAAVMRTSIGAKICRAGQQYGWIIWDKAGSVGFRAEPSVRSTSDWDSSLAPYQEIDGIKSLTFRIVAPGTDAVPFVTSP